MLAILDFFAGMGLVEKAAWLALCLTGFWYIENRHPSRPLAYSASKWYHAAINGTFLLITLLITSLFAVFSVNLLLWVQQQQVGILFLLDLPIWLELLMAVMALDLLAQYTTHYLLHKVPWLWKFHRVHHSDTAVDVTTGTRHHPGDYICREIASLLTLLLLGAPISYYLFYRSLTVFFTYFTHANFILPPRWEAIISKVFVTPKMHKFHHHYAMPWTDTNYGNAFSLWDRCFGTLVEEGYERIQYGLNILDDSRSEDIWYQLGVPFNKSIPSNRDIENT